MESLWSARLGLARLATRKARPLEEMLQVRAKREFGKLKKRQEALESRDRDGGNAAEEGNDTDESEEGAVDARFCSSARKFVVAIQQRPQDKHFAVSSEAYKACVAQEYRHRYLEQLGALPSPENLALVDRHASIHTNCTLTAAWKSRGAVDDVLYVQPSSSAGGGRRALQRRPSGPKKRERDRSAALLDQAIVDEALAQMESRRRLKAQGQQYDRGVLKVDLMQHLQHPRGKKIRDTLAVLDASFEQQQQQQEATQEEPEVQLRFDSMEACEAELATDMEALHRMPRLPEAVPFKSRSKTKKKEEKEKKREKGEGKQQRRSSEEFRLFPRRVVVERKQKNSNREDAARPNAEEFATAPFRVSCTIREELKVPVSERMQRSEHRKAIRALLEEAAPDPEGATTAVASATGFEARTATAALQQPKAAPKVAPFERKKQRLLWGALVALVRLQAKTEIIEALRGVTAVEASATASEEAGADPEEAASGAPQLVIADSLAADEASAEELEAAAKAAVRQLKRLLLQKSPRGAARELSAALRALRIVSDAVLHSLLGETVAALCDATLGVRVASTLNPFRRRCDAVVKRLVDPTGVLC